MTQSTPLTVLVACAPGISCDHLCGRIRASAHDLRIVSVTNSAAASMAVLSGHPFDLVFVDANLPRNDALNLLMYINTSRKGTRSIYLADLSAQLAKGWRLGADLGLLREFSIEELDRSIDRLLRAPVVANQSSPLLLPAS
jgi:DNA-binding response OmpR family regulator